MWTNSSYGKHLKGVYHWEFMDYVRLLGICSRSGVGAWSKAKAGIYKNAILPRNLELKLGICGRLLQAL